MCSCSSPLGEWLPSQAWTWSTEYLINKSKNYFELPEKNSAMSSSVEVNGRPLSSTTPSLMACDSFCRLCSKPSTSLSCTSKTARNRGKKHVFLHGTQKAALCRHLLLRHHFAPCIHLHSRSPHAIKGPRSVAPHATRCFVFSVQPKKLWLVNKVPWSFVPDRRPGTSLSWYSSSSYSLYCVSFN